MNRTNIKGSITVEAIVMLGLIATMTPILYKHVADRRQDIENINEANTLLLLKNATAEYIEANKEALNVGATVLSPADIGVDISGYQIGIRKDSSGNIDAMITGTGGNDMKAAKVASLLGVSAGIYSAQNTEKAWGINGVWAEDISNYGFASLPTGIPVITTAYDKEDAPAGSGESMGIEEIITLLANKEISLKGLKSESIEAGKICMNETDGSQICLNKWSDVAELTSVIDAVKEGVQCKTDIDCGNGSLECLILSGEATGICHNPIKVIERCNGTPSQPLMCSLAYDMNFNRTCAQFRKTYNNRGKEPALDAPVSIKLATNNSGGYTATRCWFPSGAKTSYTGDTAILTACNNGTDTYACRALLRANYNIYFCEDWKKLGFTADGSYRLFYNGYNSPKVRSCVMSKSPSWMVEFSESLEKEYRALFTGRYMFAVGGAQGALGGGTGGGTPSGGTAQGSKSYPKNTVFSLRIALGGSSGYAGGSGFGIYAGDTADVNNLIISAGGSGGRCYCTYCQSSGGGGYAGGAGGSGSMGGKGFALDGLDNGVAGILGAGGGGWQDNRRCGENASDGSGGGGGGGYHWCGNGSGTGKCKPYVWGGQTYGTVTLDGCTTTVGGNISGYGRIWFVGYPTADWIKPAKP